MRVFICLFNGFSLAIPMDSISSLFLCNDENTINREAAACSEENQTIFVSLFELFNLPPGEARHGIILKNILTEKNIVLLSTPVETEIEIPDNNIYPIPKTLNGLRFSFIFSGIQFASDTESNPLLFLKPENLIKYIQEEKV